MKASYSIFYADVDAAAIFSLRSLVAAKDVARSIATRTARPVAIWSEHDGRFLSTVTVFCGRARWSTGFGVSAAQAKAQEQAMLDFALSSPAIRNGVRPSLVR